MTVADRPRVVGYVLTRNEEDKVARAVRSLASVCAHVVVVDSESTDRTAEIAGGLGADVVIHPFEGFSAQRNVALDYVRSTYDPDYILTIDADEWLTDGSCGGAGSRRRGCPGCSAPGPGGTRTVW
jgi:glycosyltransferase involved in cell wall biosynthesis